MEQPAREKAYVRFAWVFLLVAGLLWIFLGVLGTYIGYQFQGIQAPAGASSATINIFNYLSGELAGVIIWIGFVLALLSWTIFREGNKWAWVIPLSLVIFMIPFSVAYSIGPLAVVILVLMVIALVLPYRKFFPRRAA